MNCYPCVFCASLDDAMSNTFGALARGEIVGLPVGRSISWVYGSKDRGCHITIWWDDGTRKGVEKNGVLRWNHGEGARYPRSCFMLCVSHASCFVQSVASNFV